MPSVRVIHADCRDAMREMAENSVDSIVTDAPYGLSKEPDMAEVLRHWLAGEDYEHGHRGFMGRRWDSFVPGPLTWREAIRVLKPGGFCLSFFGTRTYDMGAVAMRLAGFEIREMFAWLHGQGVNKVGYLRDEDGEAHLREGWGGSVRPMLEPLVMARKPLSERTIAANVRRWGTGVLNVDGCRVPTAEVEPNARKNKQGVTSPGYHGEFSGSPRGWDAAGRWPSNVAHDGSQGVLDLFPERRVNPPSKRVSERRSRNIYGEDNSPRLCHSFDADGSAARFYNAFPPDAAPFIYHPKANKLDRAGSRHPTVKPQGLMRHYCRLVSPPGGLVLDPFAGSGSTLQAARDEGFDSVGIEMDAESVIDIHARLGMPYTVAAE